MKTAHLLRWCPRPHGRRTEEGRIRPLVDKAYAFDELSAAIAFMESDAQVGKIVVRGGGN
jgi:NADPH:quinone reductase-like Zn-dependent oxidoreductase